MADLIEVTVSGEKWKTIEELCRRVVAWGDGGAVTTYGKKNAAKLAREIMAPEGVDKLEFEQVDLGEDEPGTMIGGDGPLPDPPIIKPDLDKKRPQ